MMTVIPNIVGISNQNKITTYAEDAKKFKNSAEYKFRGDATMKKPENNGECVAINLRYLHGNDYDNPPYGGEYIMDKSFVVMVKKNREYKFYVQLIEKFVVDGSNNYRGFKLMDVVDLEGDGYLNQLDEGTSLSSFVNISMSSAKSTIQSSIASITGCSNLLEVYYVA